MNRRLFGLSVALSLTALTGAALAKEPVQSGALIGTWCDMPIPSLPELDYIIEIWRDQAGQYSYHQNIKDKSKPESSVVTYWAKKRNDTWYIDNDFNEYVRIGDDAFLKIYDEVGLIRKASPVPRNTQPSKCRNQRKIG